MSLRDKLSDLEETAYYSQLSVDNFLELFLLDNESRAMGDPPEFRTRLNVLLEILKQNPITNWFGVKQLYEDGRANEAFVYFYLTHTLGLTISDLKKRLNSVYRKLALTYHPDKGGDHLSMQALNEIKDWLGGTNVGGTKVKKTRRKTKRRRTTKL